MCGKLLYSLLKLFCVISISVADKEHRSKLHFLVVEGLDSFVGPLVSPWKKGIIMSFKDAIAYQFVTSICYDIPKALYMKTHIILLYDLYTNY